MKIKVGLLCRPENIFKFKEEDIMFLMYWNKDTEWVYMHHQDFNNIKVDVVRLIEINCFRNKDDNLCNLGSGKDED